MPVKRAFKPQPNPRPDIGSEPGAVIGGGRGASKAEPTQKHVRTTPPSTRNAAPFVAEARGLHTYATRLATSSVVANRLSREVGRTISKNSFSNSANGRPPLNLATNSSTPADRVGPGNTAFTVTPVPAQVSAIPRDTASCAVLVIP